MKLTPINALTWPELARQVLMASLVKEGGGDDAACRLALFGPKHKVNGPRERSSLSLLQLRLLAR
jgi:hypothetical protein